MEYLVSSFAAQIESAVSKTPCTHQLRMQSDIKRCSIKLFAHNAAFAIHLDAVGRLNGRLICDASVNLVAGNRICYRQSFFTSLKSLYQSDCEIAMWHVNQDRAERNEIGFATKEFAEELVNKLVGKINSNKTSGLCNTPQKLDS
jgi:hypothetical protein